MPPKTLIIAEAGSNHEGSLDKAKELIDIAVECGADVCKFQYWSSSTRLAERRHAPDYLQGYMKYRMPQEWLVKLSNHCAEKNIAFMATTYLPEDIEVVDPFVNRFKIASFEATDKKFVRDHRRFKKPVIISTGMMKQIEAASLEALIYVEMMDATLLHCVSSYPTPLEAVNFHVIGGALKGFSDHTGEIHMGAYAVIRGAEIVEVHFRSYQTTEDSPDFRVSLSPVELHKYVAYIRQAEIILGDPIKKQQECEKKMAKYRVMG